MLDTDVYSALFVTPQDVVSKQGHPVDAWRSALVGRRTVISFQTRAEVLGGAFGAGWGARRVEWLRGQLDATPTIGADVDVVEAAARLYAEARAQGHPLGVAQQHVGDRWIAACAIAKSLSLLTGNVRHFDRAPRLMLLNATP